MWYEALPPLIIIGVAMSSYQYVSVVVCKLFYDRPHQRDQRDVWLRNMFARDGRIAGVPWKTPGLENIPDE